MGRHTHRSAGRPTGGPLTGREVAAGIGPVSYALADAARAHRVVLQTRLAALGLHLGQELLVVDLHHNPGSTQGQLADRLQIEQPTAAKAIVRMERSGFVERHSDETNRRIVRLQLSPKGASVVDAVMQSWAAVESATVERLTESERKQLIRLLAKVCQSLIVEE